MREEVVTIGGDRSLCGVVTVPSAHQPGHWGAVILNAGRLHRVGPHRWYVALARDLAGLGFPVVRFDRSGVGDSPARQGGRFERVAVDEVGDVMRWLTDQHGCRRFVLLGMCAGAEISFKTACEDPRVEAMVLINATRYLDEPDGEFLAGITRRHKAHRRWRLALAQPSWRRLLIGRAAAADLLRALGRRVRRAESGHASRAPAGDIAHITSMLDRDVRMLLILSDGDWPLQYAQAIFRHVTPRPLPAQVGEVALPEVNPRIEVMRGADHTLTAIAHQQAALALIAGWARGLLRRESAPVQPPESSPSGATR